MGLHPQHDIESYWTTKEGEPVHPLVRNGMARDRWGLIERYFHISLPEHGGQEPWCEESIYSPNLTSKSDVQTTLSNNILHYEINADFICASHVIGRASQISTSSIHAKHCTRLEHTLLSMKLWLDSQGGRPTLTTYL